MDNNQVSKQKLLRYVLSLNENSHINKVKMIELVKNYVLDVLMDEYNIKVELPYITFDEEGYADGGYNANNSISLAQNTFTKYQNVVEDINTLAHELRHFAQIKAKRKDKDIDNIVLVRSPERYALEAALTFNCISKGMSDEAKINILLKYHFYLNHDYYEKPFEMDARCFAVNAIYDLFQNIEDIKLSQTEKQNLDKLEKYIQDVFDYEEKIQFLCDSNIQIPKESIKQEVCELQKIVLSENSNILNLIAKNNVKELVALNEKYKFDVSRFLNQSLQLNYNDKLAHKLLQANLVALSDSLNFDKYTSFDSIKELYCFTDVQFNEKENEVLKTIIDDEQYNLLTTIKKEVAKQKEQDESNRTSC